MTTSLCARITPKPTAEIASFDCKLRDKIARRCNAENAYEGNVSTIDDSYLTYFYGLRDASNDKYDIKDLNAIIDALKAGETIDLWHSS